MALTNTCPLDTNREAVLPHFTKITDCLAEDELRKTALAVLYNLGQDFGKRRVTEICHHVLTRENLQMCEQPRPDSTALYHGCSPKVLFQKKPWILP